ncbi:MAG: hypothetical protein EP329_02755 [Deltaproteobacteria bacterium]|nr:MAG: hypothetical protein EP329_02755 [Deltaproteobacteria bacterium]
MRSPLRAALLGLALLLAPATGCELDSDECAKTQLDTPRDLPLYVFGFLSIVDDQGKAQPVPAQIPVTVRMYKHHCAGSLSGPLTYDFVTAADDNGTLTRTLSGTWSVTVKNTRDEVWFDVLVNASSTVVGSRRVGALHLCESLAADLGLRCNPTLSQCSLVRFLSDCR